MSQRNFINVITDCADATEFARSRLAFQPDQLQARLLDPGLHPRHLIGLAPMQGRHHSLFGGHLAISLDFMSSSPFAPRQRTGSAICGPPLTTFNGSAKPPTEPSLETR